MHVELWASLSSFDGRCSLRTWAYRIAHNVGASHVVRDRRLSSRLVDLEALESRISAVDGEAEVERRLSAAVLLGLIHRLKPLDRQVIIALPGRRISRIDSGSDRDHRRQRGHENSPNQEDA